MVTVPTPPAICLKRNSPTRAVEPGLIDIDPVAINRQHFAGEGGGRRAIVERSRAPGSTS